MAKMSLKRPAAKGSNGTGKPKPPTRPTPASGKQPPKSAPAKRQPVTEETPSRVAPQTRKIPRLTKTEAVVDAEFEKEETTTEETGTETETEIVETEPEGDGDEPTNRTLAFPIKPGFMRGEVEDSDFDRPRVQLTHGVGKLGTELGFTPGDIVLAEEVILWQKECNPVEITVLDMVKRFQEQLEQDSDENPRTFETAAAAEAAGLIAFGDKGEGYRPIADLTILVKKDEGVEDHAVFNIEHEGQRYALATLRIGGGSYRGVVKKINTANLYRFNSRGFFNGSFLLEAELLPGKRSPYWAFKLKNGDDYEGTMLDFVSEWVTKVLPRVAQAA